MSSRKAVGIYVQFLTVTDRYIRLSVHPTEEAAAASADAKVPGARFVRSDEEDLPPTLRAEELNQREWWPTAEPEPIATV